MELNEIPSENLGAESLVGITMIAIYASLLGLIVMMSLCGPLRDSADSSQPVDM